MNQSPLNAVEVASGNQAAVAVMAQIHRRAFELLDEKPWTSTAFEKLMASPGFFTIIIYSGSQPLGFVLSRVVDEEAELISFAIDPAFQGKGYGKQTLQLFLSLLKRKKATKLFLEVRQDNQKAITLYQAIGFKKIGERKAYYQTMSGKKLSADLFSLYDW